MNPVVTAASMQDEIRDAVWQAGTSATYSVRSTTVDVGDSTRSGADTDKTVLVSLPAPVDAEQVNQSTVLEGDLQAFLPAKGESSGDTYVALTFTPKPGDRLTVGSIVYPITKVESGAYAGTTLGYHLILRA